MIVLAWILGVYLYLVIGGCFIALLERLLHDDVDPMTRRAAIVLALEWPVGLAVFIVAAPWALAEEWAKLPKDRPVRSR